MNRKRDLNDDFYEIMAASKCRGCRRNLSKETISKKNQKYCKRCNGGE